MEGAKIKKKLMWIRGKSYHFNLPNRTLESVRTLIYRWHELAKLAVFLVCHT